MRTTRTPFVALAGLLALAGCGATTSTTPATNPTPGRVISVSMRDNRFEPDRVDARRGETITFQFRNDGLVRHEAIAGDAAAQEAHHREMGGSTMSTMSMGGHDAHVDDGPAKAVVAEPGADVDLTVTIPAAGVVMIGCHEPGHWEGGMKLTIAAA